MIGSEESHYDVRSSRTTIAPPRHGGRAHAFDGERGERGVCFFYVHVPWPTPPGHMRKEEVARAPLSSGCTRCPFRVQLDPNPCGIILGRVALGADGFHSQRGRDGGGGGCGLSAAAARSLAARSHSCDGPRGLLDRHHLAPQPPKMGGSPLPLPTARGLRHAGASGTHRSITGVPTLSCLSTRSDPETSRCAPSLPCA